MVNNWDGSVDLFESGLERVAVDEMKMNWLLMKLMNCLCRQVSTIITHHSSLITDAAAAADKCVSA